MRKFCATLMLATTTLVSLSWVHAIEPNSGYQWLSEETREMQDDEFANPGYLVVDTGRDYFKTAGKNGKSCASCHGNDGEELDAKSIAMFPKFDEQAQKPITLQGRIHACSREHLGNAPMKYDGKKAIALETFVRNLAKGERVNVNTDGPIAPFVRKGKAYFETRRGQMDMACAHCHVNYVGVRLRAQILSQGQLNGFPTFRLANQRVNGIHSRFRQCENRLRSRYERAGADEYVNLELYMMSRGNGLKIETPAVRY
jgi:sulfur-oxidizing protein SoxA